MVLKLILTAFGAALIVANAMVTRRLWRSEIVERPQKMAQTVLIWLVPGSFAVVRFLLREPRQGRSRADSTCSRDHDDFVDWRDRGRSDGADSAPAGDHPAGD